ncbi:hypothetical protein P3342_002449 [Pyrenophora teres f. teres]|uniref:Uncharacterized protein n=1 Tax=Pyrenophora teres f. teres TaxID=97479 RepID=A0A6S6W4U0_9PLEO|nr:hypothetical protein PTNB85_02607 [Pyrenophora teres f. teres]KAE8866512.1 hypothetical protein PTNB29_03659 [Pyrenophora teres f. teres]KAK1920153.1 hypothetical protein P3342_002449 [Pyrenophora teres f. teres]CAE7179711.1 hypothetical protein PTTW11_06624 [Pyrenophora teres f. teres]
MDRDAWRDSGDEYRIPDYYVNSNKSPDCYPPGNDTRIAHTPVGPTAHHVHPVPVPPSQPAMAVRPVWNDSFGAPNNHEPDVFRNRHGICSSAGASSITRGVVPTVYEHRCTQTEGFQYEGRLPATFHKDNQEEIGSLTRIQAQKKAQAVAATKAQGEALAEAILREQSDTNQMRARLQEQAKKKKKEQLYRLQRQQPQNDYIHGRLLEEQEKLFYLEKYDLIFGAASHGKSAKTTKPDRVVKGTPIRATLPEGPTDPRPMPQTSSPKTEALPDFIVRPKLRTAERTPECFPTHKAVESTIEATPERIAFIGLEAIEEILKADIDYICKFRLLHTRDKTAGKTPEPIPTRKAPRPGVNPVIVPSGYGMTTMTISQPHIPKASEEKRSGGQWPKWTEGQDFPGDFESLSLVSDINEDWEEVEGELKEWEMLEM